METFSSNEIVVREIASRDYFSLDLSGSSFAQMEGQIQVFYLSVYHDVSDSCIASQRVIGFLESQNKQLVEI